MSRINYTEQDEEKYKLLHEEFEISLVSSVCSLCNNFYRKNASKRQCAAFPEGIPLEIWKGKNDHTQPFEGDGGIRYEKYVHKNPDISKLEIEIIDGQRRFKK